MGLPPLSWPRWPGGPHPAGKGGRRERPGPGQRREGCAGSGSACLGRPPTALPSGPFYQKFKALTLLAVSPILDWEGGGVAERSMAAVLKTALASGERGVESHPLRQAFLAV